MCYNSIEFGINGIGSLVFNELFTFRQPNSLLVDVFQADTHLRFTHTHACYTRRSSFVSFRQSPPSRPVCVCVRVCFA